VKYKKRLLKAKTSLVMSTDTSIILANASDSKFYHRLVNRNEFVVTTDAAAKRFLKMLNDDYVYSSLTGADYDAAAKQVAKETEE
jgi:hypothetical protein